MAIISPYGIDPRMMAQNFAQQYRGLSPYPPRTDFSPISSTPGAMGPLALPMSKPPAGLDFYMQAQPTISTASGFQFAPGSAIPTGYIDPFAAIKQQDATMFGPLPQQAQTGQPSTQQGGLGLTDVLGALSNQINNLSFTQPQFKASVTQTSTPSISSTTNPNIGLK